MFDSEAREAALRARRNFEQGIQAAEPALGKALADMMALNGELSMSHKSLLLQVRDGFRKAAGNFV